MNDWSADVSSLIGGLGKEIIGAARAVRAMLNNDPFEVLAYRGYGNATRAFIYGRVLKKRDVSLSSDRDSTFRNLLNMYRRADSDPLAFASVTVDYAEQSVGMQADDEGFFGGWIELANSVEADKEWRDYDVRLVSHSRPTAGDVTAKGEILTPQTGVQFGVISDLDDTVIQSRVSNFLQAARGVLLGNARTRLPFPGVAAFYEALRNGADGEEKNPIFYVSSSPWNIYDVIAEFMDIQKIPKGPIFLRDWDIGWDSLSPAHHFDHKTKVIRSILELYPALQFILIGDTSQHDPEIYHQIVTEFPNRVGAIYIRDVTRTAERSGLVKKLAEEVLAQHSTLVLSEDTLGAAKHAIDEGWIRSDALEDVRQEKRADEGSDETKVPSPDGGKPSSGEPPTVIG